jgi:hypothetical protein
LEAEIKLIPIGHVKVLRISQYWISGREGGSLIRPLWHDAGPLPKRGNEANDFEQHPKVRSNPP